MINPYNISIQVCIYFVVLVLYNNYVGHVYITFFVWLYNDIPRNIIIY